MTKVPTDDSRGAGKPTALVALVALSVLLNYIDRGAIGIAAPLMKAELGLSATTFGLAVSAFFWTYVPFNLLVGWLCDRVSVSRLFALGVALWAASTLLTGLAGGLASLVALRLALGAGESVAFPGSSKIFASRVPARNRGTVNAVVAAAIGFGPTIGTVAGGLILAKFGWRPIFVLFGAVTLLWLLPWFVVAAPFEREKVHDDVAAPPAILPLLREPALWKMGVAHFCSNYGFYFTLSWTPLYLTQVRGYSIAEMTGIASLGILTPVLAPFVGVWSDRMIASGASEDRVRRGLMIFAQAAGAASLAGTALSHSTGALVFWVLVGAIATSGGATNIFAVGQIFGGPRRTGGWMGIQNTFGNVSGVLGPVITGLIIDRLGGYGWGFALAAGVAFLGAIWWLLIIPPIREIETAEQQPPQSFTAVRG